MTAVNSNQKQYSMWEATCLLSKGVWLVSKLLFKIMLFFFSLFFILTFIMGAHGNRG